MSSPEVIQEFERRIAKERAKALAKYGKDALVPGGRPDLDVLDYAANEAVGFVRYGQMIHARHEQMLKLMEELTPGHRQVLREAMALGRELEAFGARYAYDILGIRERLKKYHAHLGLTEEAT